MPRHDVNVAVYSLARVQYSLYTLISLGTVHRAPAWTSCEQAAGCLQGMDSVHSLLQATHVCGTGACNQAESHRNLS